MANTCDLQLVLRLEAACVNKDAQSTLLWLFWVIYLGSFQRKSEQLQESLRSRIAFAWMNFFASVHAPKEQVMDRFSLILAEALLTLFLEAFPKSRSQVLSKDFIVNVYRSVFKELLG